MLILVVMAASVSAASVWTDKDDYNPGASVLISGSGFAPNTQITRIEITRPDGTVEACPMFRCDTLPVTNNEGFFYNYAYSLNGIVGTYIVTVSDGITTTQTTFTDARTLNSVRLNGASAVTVSPGASINVTVNVTLTSSSTWRTTRTEISGQGTVCTDTTDHTSAGTYVETFAITAPTAPGTYNLTVRAYDSTDCTGSSSHYTSTTITNAITILGCGDGIITAPETCDDANTANGDGCSSTCSIESGWTCSGQPSVCKVPNPVLPGSCGVDMVLIIDDSGSISSAKLTQMKNAFKNFTDAFLPNTPTQIAVVDFDTLARLRQGYTSDKTLIKNAIDASSGGGTTNWDDALREAYAHFDNRADKPDIYIFASDGNPNTYGDSGTYTDEATALGYAVKDANQIKLSGIRIITLGIGDSINPANLKAISSDDAYYSTNFDTLATTLAGLADDLCGGSVVVRKYVDDVPTSGWTFSASSTGGTVSPPSGSTDVQGYIVFDVNTTSSALVDISETIPSGYHFSNVSCYDENKTSVGTPGTGTITGIPVFKNDLVYCSFYNTKAECRTNADCAYMNKNFCEGNNWVHQTGSCVSGTCAMASSTASCDDGIACNGQETCVGDGICQNGTAVDCSANNIASVWTCDNNPDSFSATFDYRPEFSSTCTEPSGTCTTGDTAITHTCADSNNSDGGPLPPIFYSAAVPPALTCTAECDGFGTECQPKLVDNTCYYGGSCDTKSTCSCQYTTATCPAPGTVLDGVCYYGTQECNVDGCTDLKGPMGCRNVCDPKLGPIDTTGPVIVSMNVSPNPAGRFCSNKVVSTQIEDCANIADAEYYVHNAGTTNTCSPEGSLPWGKMNATDGAFDSTYENASAVLDVTGLQDGGNYKYCVRAKNADGYWSSCECKRLEVDTAHPVLQTDNVAPIHWTDANGQWVCADNFNFSAYYCDTESCIAGAEYFIKPPQDWDWVAGTGHPMLPTDGAFSEPETKCDWAYDTVINSQYTEGTHLIKTEAIDCACNWGKLIFDTPSKIVIDRTPPVITKTVSDPKFKCDYYGDEKEANMCNYVNQSTSITLNANDVDNSWDHVYSDDITIHYRTRYKLNYTDTWGPWTAWVDVHANTTTFKFSEDSIHEVEYYVTDKCGNPSPHYYEIDIVDSKPPITTKEITGPQLDGTEGIHKYLNANSVITLTCTDQQPHPIGGEILNWQMFWKKEAGDDWTPVSSGSERGSKIFSGLEDSYHKFVYYCVDALGNSEAPHTEIDVVDNQAPELTKTITGPQVRGSGDPVHMYITKDSVINLTCIDKMPHPVGGELINWSMYWKMNEGDEWQFVESGSGETNVLFSNLNDSYHKLVYSCADALGNKVSEEEVDAVDNTPPITTKRVGEPSVKCSVEDPNKCDYYVTQSTPIYLDCNDQMPHPVGVNYLEYRYKVNDGEFTAWMNFTKDPIKYGQDSRHTLEYRCVDLLGNAEATQTEVDIVDTLAPNLIKIVGDPKVSCTDGEDCDYYMTKATPITINCTDKMPHPVGNVTIHYMWALNGDPGKWYDYNGESVTFSYPTDSRHTLYYYCDDQLGNSVRGEEVDIVDTQPPVTTKEVIGPKVKCSVEDPNKCDYYVTSATKINLTCTDQDPHPVGVEQICYSWYLDGRSPFPVEMNVGGNMTVGEFSIKLASVSGGSAVIEIYELSSLIKTYTLSDGESVLWTAPDLDNFMIKVSGITESSAGVAFYNTKKAFDGCVEGNSVEFSYPTDSRHTLNYYCVDRLGNKEDTQTEVDVVDNQPPSVTKILGDPKIIVSGEEVCTNESGGGGEPGSGPGPASPHLGAFVGKVNFSENCASNIGVGVAYDGKNLWYTCYNSYYDLFKADPFTGQVISKFHVVGGLGAIAYDSGRNAMWAGWGGPTYDQVLLLQLDGEKNYSTHSTAFNANTGGLSIDDGIAYDSSDDTVYVSPDVSATIFHYKSDGTPIGTFAKAPGSGCGNSGLAIGGDLLYEGFNGCNQVIVVNKSATSVPVFSFNTNVVPGDTSFRDEGLACDTNTFASSGRHVMWSVEAYDGSYASGLPRRAVAFEIPFGTCGVGGKPPEPSTNCSKVEVAYITQKTPITLECSDIDPHPVGGVSIFYRYSVDGGEFTNWTTYEGPFTFGEDSEHLLEYYCEDALGNKGEVQTELDKVDSTSPETIKTYGIPSVVRGESRWITSETPISLNATDGGVICAVGVNKTYYNWTRVDDSLCYRGCELSDDIKLDSVVLDHEGTWTEYTGPFTIPEDSCHMITYYSVDKLGNEEIVKRQCTFVDNKPPVTTKEVGKPSIVCKEGEGCHFWVTNMTDITLTCTDQDPHPVDNVTLYYRYNVDGGEFTNWTTYEGPIRFQEDSVHYLEYYCKDELGNTEVVKNETDKVDNTPPKTEKIIMGCHTRCTKGEECDYWVNKDTTFGFNATDGGAICAVGVDYTTYLKDDYVWETYNPANNISFSDEGEHRLAYYSVDLLGNFEPEKAEYDIVDNTPPRAWVLNPTPGRWYHDGETFTVYAPAADFGKPPSGVATCELYALDIHFEDLSPTDLVKVINMMGKPSEFADLLAFLGDRYTLVSLGTVPYESGVCKGTATIPNPSNLTDKAYLVIKVTDRSCNEYFDFARGSECTFGEKDCDTILMDIDNAPPFIKIIKTEGLEGPAGKGDSFAVYLEATDFESNLFQCSGEITQGGCSFETHDPVLTPTSVEAWLKPGESVNEVKNVTTSSTPITAVDVLFSLDLTGSMGGVTSETKSSSVTIMNNVRALVPDSQFGASSFRDYPGYYSGCGYADTYGGYSDLPWMLGQDITSDTSAVSSAINTYYASGGSDGPESYTRALYEAGASVGFRPGAKKIVVMFGDSVPHDCNFLGYSTGPDPGRDNTVGTADDLDFETVVAGLAAKKISVIYVDAGSEASTWQYVANATGGQYYQLESYSEIPGAISSMIGTETSKISLVTIDVTPGYESWVTWSPDNYTDVVGNQTLIFQVKITVPEDTPEGNYTFNIRVDGDGSTLREQNVTIHVGGCTKTEERHFDFPGEILSDHTCKVYGTIPKELQDGSHTLWLYGMDFEYNRGNASTTVIVDNSAPGKMVYSPTPGYYGATIPVKVGMWDDTGIAPETVQYRIYENEGSLGGIPLGPLFDTGWLNTTLTEGDVFNGNYTATYNASSMESGKLYFFRTRGCNALYDPPLPAGAEIPDHCTDPVMAIIIDLVPPVGPTNVVISGNQITWTAAYDALSGVDHYSIYDGSGKIAETKALWYNVTNSSATYWVSATDKVANEGSKVKAMPPEAPPSGGSNTPDSGGGANPPTTPGTGGGSSGYTGSSSGGSIGGSGGGTGGSSGSGGSAPVCQAIGAVCSATSDCCEGYCMSNVCTAKTETGKGVTDTIDVFAPESVDVGTFVTVTAKHHTDGKPLIGAELDVVLPSGEVVKRTTDENGQVKFTAQTQGWYKYVVPGYEKGTVTYTYASAKVETTAPSGGSAAPPSGGGSPPVSPTSGLLFGVLAPELAGLLILLLLIAGYLGYRKYKEGQEG